MEPYLDPKRAKEPAETVHRPSGNPDKTSVGVGMPQTLWLHEFGSQIEFAFGDTPFQVGSSLNSKVWRDVDVRLILDDKEYDAMGLGKPEECQQNGKWVALCLAFSALGKEMTGLPIDFQIQRRTEANNMYPTKYGNHNRSALGFTPLRMAGLKN